MEGNKAISGVFAHVHAPHHPPPYPDQQPADITQRECPLLASVLNRFPKGFFLFCFVSYQRVNSVLYS